MGLKGKLVTGGAGALVLALGLISRWEGLETKVYLDPVGIPTVCYGHVVPKDIKVGTQFTNEACHSILYSDLVIASNTVDNLVKTKLDDNVKAAAVSFVFNVGAGNFRNSTFLKLLNEGRIVEACHELPKWVYAKGKKLQGLVNRRNAEMQLCLGNV